MIKYLIILSFFFLISCSTTKQTVSTYNENFSFKDEINNSIIDGFYCDSDTTKNIYLLE